jgi:hypothetical protein
MHTTASKVEMKFAASVTTSFITLTTDWRRKMLSTKQSELTSSVNLVSFCPVYFLYVLNEADINKFNSILIIKTQSKA